MKIEQIVCNVCRDVTRSTRQYTVGSGVRSADVDLCEEHAAPLEALLPAPELPRRAPRKVPVKKAAPSAKRGGRRPVLTLAEIEQLKANSK